MKRISLFLLASMFSFGCANRAYGQDYQKIADSTPWTWAPERASITDSFLKFPNTYQVELIRKKDKYDQIIVRLVDNGKELVAWQGHQRSVFCLKGDVLVYADFNSSTSGCIVIAYDLKKQKRLWKTDLNGLGPIDHFEYANEVNLEIISKEAVRVFGNEFAGQYLEIVDLKTGKTVGHRMYKK